MFLIIILCNEEVSCVSLKYCYIYFHFHSLHDSTLMNHITKENFPLLFSLLFMRSFPAYMTAREFVGYN
jgi:hypothetical protein